MNERTEMTLKLKPKYLKENGKAKFVVLTIEDFIHIQEALENAEDFRILEKAKRRGAKAARIPHDQIKREFGVLSRGARKAAG
jgi:hypothetical protein